MNIIIGAEDDLKEELAGTQPRRSPEILSRNEREIALERGLTGLYRWYVDRSQMTRNWNPDKSFDWKNFKTDHSDEMLIILEGFFAVEQFSADFTMGITQVIRKHHGRAAFQLRWGAEEQRHGDLWMNCLLFSRRRSRDQIEKRMSALRDVPQWEPQWNDPIRMVMWQVFQERATQINYINVAKAADGNPESDLKKDVDPVLNHVARTIAVDEAAHFNFYLEAARLYFYYFPEETAHALLDVVRNYRMPGRELLSNYSEFGKTLQTTGIFTLKENYHLDTLKFCLKHFGINAIRTFEQVVLGTENTDSKERTIFRAINFDFLEESVRKTFSKINKYERETGLSQVINTNFVENPAMTLAQK